MDELKIRGVANIIPNYQALEEVLKNRVKLNIYLGIDPTATKIHLGHAVVLRVLQKFAELGHNVFFLIGDFTALIGDTSDKDTERPVLTKEQIEENFATYKEQASKILNFELVKVVYNSVWLSELKFEDIIKLCQNFSAGDFYSRELIKTRLNSGKRVGLHELLYSVMQGYDSYYLDTDLQIGGTDQTFNMQAGRILQKNLRGKESFVLTTEFLIGTDGRKMSKSWGNAVWLDDEPNDIFGKIMSIKDELVMDYFRLATNLGDDLINEYKQRLDNGDNPMIIKKILAYTIVSELYNEVLAGKAEESFGLMFQRGIFGAEVSVLSLEVNQLTALELVNLSGLYNSNSEARRLIEQGGLKVNDQKYADSSQMIILNSGDIVKFGKRHYYKIEIN